MSPGATVPVPAAPPGHGPWAGAHWHLPAVVRPRRRTAGAAGLVVGAAAAVTAVVVLVGGSSGGGGRAEAGGHGAGVALSPTASAPGDAVPSPSAPPSLARTAPEGGEVYRGIRLAAGYALSVRDTPPTVRPGPYSGAFGFTAQGDGFVSDVHQATLALLDPTRPPTPASCRDGATAQVATVPRRSVTGGTRVCVRSVDGTVALVTVRGLTAPGAPQAAATLDVIVWRPSGRSAEGDQ